MKTITRISLASLFLVFFGIFSASAADTLATSAVSAGSSHGLALRSDGTIWAWGTNRIGEVGLGTNALVLSPKRITSLSNVLAISAGPLHSLAIQSNGQVWAWGTNGNGRLGNGTFNNTSNPVPVSIITNATGVAAGVSHSLAILADGRAMAWGDNSGGQLGNGNTVATNRPVFVNALTNVISVAGGSNFSLALTSVGEVWAWGTNNFGQLGIGNNNSQTSPTKVASLSNVVQIAAGHSHALAMDGTGRIYGWGRNTEGQIGNGGTANFNSPTLLTNFGPATTLGAAKWVAANFNSSAAIGTSQNLYYWGRYGNGTAAGSVTLPTLLGGRMGKKFDRVAYGNDFLLAVQPDSSVWAWGFNLYGNWGNGFYYSSFDTWRYETSNSEFCFSARPTSFTTRFNRGDRYWYDAYNSFVLPLDLQEGVTLDSEGNDLYCYGSSKPWFLKIGKTTRQHARNLVSGSMTRFNVDNPIVAFGSEAGASPLYTSQPYRFGIYAGAYEEAVAQPNRIRVLVYDRTAFTAGATNVQPTNVFTIALPRRDIAADNAAWTTFVTNGNRVVVETNGLRTIVEFQDGYNSPNGSFNNWGVAWQYAIPSNVMLVGYKFTHTASSTNYYYVIEALGSAEIGANSFTPMGLTSGVAAYLPLYALGFENFPAWRSRFVDSPHFEGIPLPPVYAGRQEAELDGLIAAATNNIWITNISAYTNLDNSPELRRHPILDQLVEDLGRNPLALASYVINEIELTDPMGLQETSKQVADSIEVGGVNRSALSTFLEGQGSPTEQCALLVYLLRQAGYSAGYVFPTNSNLRLLDTRLSQLWQVNVKGVIYYTGVPVITNSLIVVNYPWVVANIGTNCVHIFPWLKNTEIVEGLDVYNYLPTNYPSAYEWVKDFAFAKPELMGLGSPNDGAAKIWQRYLTSVINTNKLQSNLSLDDFGVRAFNRRDSYPTWGHLPSPNFLTNQSQVAVVPTLSESAVTYPFLTNMFDQIRVEVFKTDTNIANRIFDTGLWRSCDFHNRKLLLYTNAPNNVSLWLAAYRTNFTAITNFQNSNVGSNSLYNQLVQTSIAATVTNLPIRITYQRRNKTLASPTSWFPALNYFSDTFPPLTSPSTRDVTAIIPSVARVTPAMLQVHAEDYWRLEQQRALNPNFTPDVKDDAGTASMLLALNFFEKLWTDDAFNQRLHKIRAMTWNSWGVAAVTRLSNNKMQAKMNMNWFSTQVLGNGRLRQDSGDRGLAALNNYLTMLQANGCSAEHSVLYSLFKDENPVSSIRLLQLAAERGRSNGWAQPLELQLRNYVALGGAAYTGYGATLLRNQDPVLWQKVTNVFVSQWDSNYVRALITPGPVTNVSGNFKGMSSLHFGEWNTGAIMSDNQTILNGGFTADLFWISVPSTPSYQLPYSLQYSPTLGLSFDFNDFVTPRPRVVFSPYDVMTITATSGVNKVEFTPQQMSQAAIVAGGLNLPGSTTANTIKVAKDKGYFGPATAAGQQNDSIVSDPVHVVSGDFYADSVDLTLAGPMPLQLRRNYMSRSLVDNQFGYGWKLGFTPWLVLSTNASGNRFIYAAEPDGAVLAYRFQSNNLWTVTATDNPSLVNFTLAGVGSTANQFNRRIEQNPTNSTLYTLVSPDGSKRFFQEMTSFGLSSGTNSLSRIRPYLTRWEDHAGNYYLFSYGTNSQANDFGQLARVASANGASLVFKYDFHSRVIEAITDDERHVRYLYDDYGDLARVTLPDNSAWEYEYQHYTFTTNSQTYTDSNHLLVRERKPDGRLLQNDYDSLRRVTLQAATVGTNRVLVTNAWFFYTNNCNSLTNEYITGVTRIEDAFHTPYLYFYTNNLITRIEEPNGRINTQDWFEASETNKPGYYPRSLELAVDPRGLTNEFRYDANGNVTNLTLRGDLTGNGTGNDVATTTFTFTNNLPASITDPTGNQQAFFYEDPTDAFRVTRIEISSSGVGIATNRFSYTNVTTTTYMGGWFKTNQAFGLRSRAIIADTATNEWFFDGRGFPVQTVRHVKTADYSANTDPAVTNFFAFTSRGEPYQRADAAGRRIQMNFDVMGRLEWREIISETGDVLGREDFYYNRNGELEWYDGVRSNPEDYVHFDYDGAGRLTEEIRWRSRAKADGSGVEAEDGYNLYATTFHRYDYLGNIVATVNPRGTLTTNSYDALGRVVSLKVFDSAGVLLTSKGFAYEPGGLMTFHTNALQGVTERQYTSTGQPKFQRNPDGSTNAWRYYTDGRLYRQIQNNGAFLETTYNDSNRKITQVFYSTNAQPLTTNSFELDRRGNLVKRTDEAGYSFTNLFDGLGRVKIAAGPAIKIVKEDCGPAPGCGVFVTNIFQQKVTSFYDAAGIVFTNVNALGEKSIAFADALGRITRTEVRNTNNVLVSVASTSYANDHHSLTVTNGSGTDAIVNTTFTDNDGRSVLSIAYPSAATREYVRREYDLVGNPSYEERVSTDNGSTIWRNSSFAFDGLNRLSQISDRDGAVTQYHYDLEGSVTNRVMPGGLQWNAIYNNAGQTLQDWNTGAGGIGTRTNTYSYFAAAHPFAGLLQRITDGRGATCTRSYDDWLRSSSAAYTNASPDDFVITVLRYDQRGFATNLTETGDSAGTEVQRQFDAYGQLVSENIIAGVVQSSATQEWDTAGRRSRLSINGQPSITSYSFGWRADGLLTSVSTPMGGASYGYTTAGVLTNRTIGSRMTAITSLDGVGRPLSMTTKVSLLDKLTETLTWTGDGLLATHTLAREDFTDSRQYSYAQLSRRLTEERLNLNAATRWTNSFTYDGGQSSGPGALTKVGAPSASAQWAGATDNFSRINTETNLNIRRLAYGRANGTATITALLDGKPQAVSAQTAQDMQWPNRWQSLLEIPQGTHELSVTAAHPSGLFTTNATVWFTNNLASENATSTYDAMGNVSRRVWKNPDGTTNRIQTLVWDPKGQLTQVSDLDSQTNGLDWFTYYDAFGRRIHSYSYQVANGQYVAGGAVILHYYDPEVEFLEVGARVEWKTTWKLHGPDASGVYGGMQGVGGFDAVFDQFTFNPTISDLRGNILGTVTNGVVSWTGARSTGYGAVPGYRPPVLGNGGDMITASAWRGVWGDITGFYWRGKRYYDPISGGWMSSDPVWNGGDPNYHTFCGGDPINYFDPDGRRFGTGKNLAAINQTRIANGLLPLTADGYAPCVVCHGMSAFGPIPGVPLTYSYVGGQVYNSGGNRQIIGNYTAGAAGQIASIPQQIGNFLAYPIALMAADDFVPMGDYFNAAGTEKAVQTTVYADVDSQSLLTTSGKFGGDALLVLAPKIPLPARAVSAEASTAMRGMRIRLNPRTAELGGINISGANAPTKTINVGPAGHHVPAVRKTVGRPFEVGRGDKTRPTIFSRGSNPAHDHWRMHDAERAHVGPRQGAFQGTDDELFNSYRKAYEGLDDIRVDVRSPDGSRVLGTDVTPRQAVDLIENWLHEQGLR